ncbi:MAG TPA: SPW repeat protein [Burkholderiales bacterium]|nr:SPW repeat protein [Burkholderiales bacterium]
MEPRAHWRDVVIGLAGAWLVASPSVLGYDLDPAAAANAFGAGFGLVIFCIISAWRLTDLGNEIVNIVFGGWLVLSPYALGFSGERAATLNAISVGLVVAALAAWDLHSARKPE